MGASYTFENGTPTGLADTTVSESGYPVFVMAWVNLHTAVLANDVTTSLRQAGSSRGLSIQQNTSPDVFLYRMRGNTATISFDGSTSVIIGVWYHVVSLARSATDHELFLNGVSDGTSSSDAGTNTSQVRFTVGCSYLSSIGSANDANIAYVGYGTTSITDTQIKEAMYNPTFAASICDSFYNLTEGGATVVGDYKDITGNGAMDAGTVPTESFDGPPVSFPQMQG